MDRTLVPEPLQPPTLGPLEEREKALALSARQARWSLLQSRVLCFGLLQDGDVGVGVFPECEEILKRGASFAGVALHSIGAGQAQMCEESAGKRRRRSITPGNRWLKQALVQAAWAASHSKNTYLASQYRRVAGHRGKKRALIAVGHSILVIFYHTIKSGCVA